MKACVECKEPKELSAYGTDNATPDRKKGICRACVAIYNKNRYDNYPERARRAKQSAKKWERKFFNEHGLPFSTFRGWLRREWDMSTADLPEANRKEFIEKCKKRNEDV
jgi:hypothetical protein